MKCENCGNENVKIINTARNTYVCEKCGRDTESLFEIKLYKEIRNKVIDEFAEKFIYKAVCSGCSGCTNCYEEQRQCECEDWKSYMEIAEQMKQTHECD